MLRRLGLLFAALALFSIAGGHWAVLQTVAWAGMLRDYTQKTGSVAAAVGQTFDGAHPCELCLQIASAKQQEVKAEGDKPQNSSKQKVAKAEKNDQALMLARNLPFVRTAATSLWWDNCHPQHGPSREDQPPTPPPRAGALAA